MLLHVLALQDHFHDLQLIVHAVRLVERLFAEMLERIDEDIVPCIMFVFSMSTRLAGVPACA